MRLVQERDVALAQDGRARAGVEEVVQLHCAAARVDARGDGVGEAAHGVGERVAAARQPPSSASSTRARCVSTTATMSCLAAGEVHIKGAARIAGARADVVEARSVEALLAEERGGGVDERGALCSLVSLRDSAVLRRRECPRRLIVFDIPVRM